jgi:hypothetical protein
MPRLDHSVPVGKQLSTEERAIVLLMQDLVNHVRVHVGLAPMQAHEVEQQLRQILRAERRKDQG